MFETIVSYLKKSFIFSNCCSILEAGSFVGSLAPRFTSAAEASRLFSLAAGRSLVAMPLAEPSKEEI
jgi:hypothetical protein